MNWIKLHIGDFVKQTFDLSAGQIGAYILLLVWYYSHRRALPLDLGELQQIARCHNAEERKALELVLARFFRRAETGYHNGRCDRELELHGGTSPAPITEHHTEYHVISPLTSRVVSTRKWRAARVHLITSLAAKGIKVQQDAPMRRLRDLAEEHGVPIGEVNGDVTVISPLDHGEQIVDNRIQEARIQEPASRAAPARTHEAGEACKAMRQNGVQSVNPSHPQLLALLEAGATVDELRLTAAECVAIGKPNFAYVLATVAGRRRDVVQPQTASGRPLNARQLHDRAVVEALAPALLPGASWPAISDPSTPHD